MTDRSKSAPRPSFKDLVEEAKKNSGLMPHDIFYLYKKPQPCNLSKMQPRQIIAQRPPLPHLHIEKEYKNTSPLRNKLMIREAKIGLRKIMKRRSLNESDFFTSSGTSSAKRGTISTAVSRGNLSPKDVNQTFVESISKHISTIFSKEKECTNSLFKRCQETYMKQIKNITSSENTEFFSEQDKTEACKDYLSVQKKINIISKGRVNRSNIHPRPALAVRNI
ncbi:unnamed protein product [Blepharisma stoltei]|uniref:Uncharacterized protein n=1 Tax=Blepharisma stoltei TaxID=1481888 RepID=A0AAU9J3G0_9CILI|nr:unnamed protein product [Blepharisma stoltei]